MSNLIESILKTKLTPQEELIVSNLEQVKLFENFKVQELRKLIPFIFERKYKGNEVLFFRNDPSQALYILFEGKVEFNLDMDDSTEVLFVAEEKGAIGINSILENRKRDFNAIVKSEEAILYVVAQTDLFEFFEQNPILKSKMLENLSKMYDDMFCNIFNVYRRNIGFFELKKIFDSK